MHDRANCNLVFSDPLTNTARSYQFKACRQEGVANRTNDKVMGDPLMIIIILYWHNHITMYKRPAITSVIGLHASDLQVFGCESASCGVFTGFKTTQQRHCRPKITTSNRI